MPRIRRRHGRVLRAEGGCCRPGSRGGRHGRDHVRAGRERPGGPDGPRGGPSARPQPAVCRQRWCGHALRSRA
eukprot:scaffold1558_cov30-Prasinocladus_malaysianus.AAC.1